MFGLSSLELRLAAYGLLLAAIGGWLLYERGQLIHEGEARIKAQDATARAAQKAEDDKISAGVVNDLKSKLAAIPPAQPPPVLRLCQSPSSVRESAAASGTKPSVASTDGSSANGMPEGTSGLDIGQPVLDAARASEIRAIYRSELWDWAVKQAQR